MKQLIRKSFLIVPKLLLLVCFCINAVAQDTSVQTQNTSADDATFKGYALLAIVVVLLILVFVLITKHFSRDQFR